MVTGRKDLKGDQSETADVCIIGSGAGGAVAAKELAEAGLSVVMLEAGSYHDPAEFSRYEPEMLQRLFWDGGMRATHNGAVQIYQGLGVGGSTVHNLCYAVRTPDAILNKWQTQFELHELSPVDLAPSLERVERNLGVKPIPEEQVNVLNRVIRRGCQSLGWHGTLQRHNREPCPGCSAGCMLGCPHSGPGTGKQSMAVTYIPHALRAGARLYSNCMARTILVENSRVVGVAARTLSEDGSPGHNFIVRSRAVILAAGAINSAQLWLNSRTPDPGKQARRNLHLHPAIFLGGVFDEEIDAYHGIPQSFYIDQFLDLEADSDSGYLLMPIFGPPVVVAASLPSFGEEHWELMRHYRHMCGMLVLLHDRSSGRVTVDGHGYPVVRYSLSRADRALLMDGLERCAQLLFAAGARQVIIPYTRRVVIETPRELDIIRHRGIVENDILMASSHPQGTLRMGTDPQRSVVDSYGRAHAVRGLFVADASLFPTSIAVPPTLTIAAMADRIARHLVANWPP